MKKRKWPKKKLHWQFIDLYNVGVWMATSRKVYNQAMTYLKSECRAEGVAGRASYLLSDTGNSLFIVGVFDGGMDTLVHELGHTALQLCAFLNIDPSAAQGEPFCYIQSFLFDKFKDRIDAK